MHILYASDEHYVRHAAASMVSLIEHNAGQGHVIHYLSMGVSEESLGRLQALCETNGWEFQPHELGDIHAWFDFSVNARGFAPSALARLFLGRILPESVTRVIYLDCDTIVLDNLAPLWETDMGEKCIGMVPEPTVTKARRAHLGMPDSVSYCNSGVLLIDLAQWRAQHVEETVLNYYRAMGGDLVAPDQDALCGALLDRIYILSPRYNYGSVQIYYPWKAQKRISAPTPFMAETAYREAVAHPAIVHFLGEERPWRAGNHHPYRQAYEQALSKTPWKDAPMESGWQTYFVCFGLFNWVMKPFPYLRWKIIDALIPAFMRRREKQLKRQAG